MNEMEADISVVTETWLSDGDSLQTDLDDLEHGVDLGCVYKNRPTNARGFSHGGVAIIYRKSNVTMKPLEIPNPDDFERLVAVGTVRGHARKLAVVAIYLPPNYTASRASSHRPSCLLYTSPSPRDS